MTNLEQTNSVNPLSDLRLISLQLQKDFLMYGRTLIIDEVENFSQLKSVLSSHINHLMEINRKKLMQIIYRIDISERALAQVLSQENQQDFSSEISDLMIERTRLKIQIRRNNSHS